MRRVGKVGAGMSEVAGIKRVTQRRGEEGEEESSCLCTRVNRHNPLAWRDGEGTDKGSRVVRRWGKMWLRLCIGAA